MLTAQPTNNVTVTTARASGTTNLNVTAGSPLTFTPGNWNTPQNVTITSTPDANAATEAAVFNVTSTGLHDAHGHSDRRRYRCALAAGVAADA